jgi:Tol biopolymer transport system component
VDPAVTRTQHGVIAMAGRSSIKRYIAFAASLAVAVATPSSAALAASVTDPGATTSRVSVTDTGASGVPDANGGASFQSAVSAHGRFVAFASNAVFAPGDVNDTPDIYVRDRLAGTTRLVSTSSTGRPGNSFSLDPSISANGRYVAFDSSSTNFGPNSNPNVYNVYRKDLLTGQLIRVSVGVAGQVPDGNSQFASISADGTKVAFDSAADNLVRGDTNGTGDVFVRDLTTGVTRLVSIGMGGHPANGLSYAPTVSADGRFVVWPSFASNLVAGDTNHLEDAFMRDLASGVTRRVSVSTTNAQGNGASGGEGGGKTPIAVSAYGRFVAFESHASNLAPNDSNGVEDVFVRDVVAGITKRVSLTSDGHQGNGDSFSPDISADGRFVTYTSGAENLVADDSNGNLDIFVRDRSNGATTRVSVGPGGRQANDTSIDPAISADGQHVTWTSDAYDLVDDDTNGATDVFARDARTDSA